MKQSCFSALLLNAGICCVLFAYAQEPLFRSAPGSPVDVGEGSGHLVIADVNRDGNPDLIAQHLQQRMITIELGDGKGRFSTAPDSPIKLSYSPGDVKCADLNGDGFPDLVIAGSERNAVDIFRGDGTGRFSLAPGSPVVVSPSPEFNTYGLQLLDINEDGKTDIITTSNKGNTFSTLPGNGRGSFATATTVTFPASAGRYTFAFGDVDGDSHLDVVVANSGDGMSSDPSRVLILPGDGKGAFKTSDPVMTSVPSGPRYVAIGDMNGDQRPELLLSYQNHISVLTNQRGGKFTRGADYDLTTDCWAVAAADVNGDRLNDLVIATVDSVTVALNGKNGFVLAQGSPFKAGPGAYYVALGDVNRDGKLDVAASSFEGNAVTVLLGR